MEDWCRQRLEDQAVLNVSLEENAKALSVIEVVIGALGSLDSLFLMKFFGTVSIRFYHSVDDC